MKGHIWILNHVISNCNGLHIQASCISYWNKRICRYFCINYLNYLWGNHIWSVACATGVTQLFFFLATPDSYITLQIFVTIWFALRTNAYNWLHGVLLIFLSPIADVVNGVSRNSITIDFNRHCSYASPNLFLCLRPFRFIFDVQIYQKI